MQSHIHHHTIRHRQTLAHRHTQFRAEGHPHITSNKYTLSDGTVTQLHINRHTIIQTSSHNHTYIVTQSHTHRYTVTHRHTHFRAGGHPYITCNKSHSQTCHTITLTRSHSRTYRRGMNDQTFSPNPRKRERKKKKATTTTRHIIAQSQIHCLKHSSSGEETSLTATYIHERKIVTQSHRHCHTQTVGRETLFLAIFTMTPATHTRTLSLRSGPETVSNRRRQTSPLKKRLKEPVNSLIVQPVNLASLIGTIRCDSVCVTLSLCVCVCV